MSGTKSGGTNKTRELFPEPKIKTLLPWFGGNRMLGPEVGKLLAGCSWVGIPFAGGMPELLYIKASTIVVSDLHREVINLAKTLADPSLGPKMIRVLRRLPFHPDVLEYAQDHCMERDSHRRFIAMCGICDELPISVIDALAYFVSQWMGRSESTEPGTSCRSRRTA